MSKVGTGFGRETLGSIHEQLLALARTDSPFAKGSPRRSRPLLGGAPTRLRSGVHRMDGRRRLAAPVVSGPARRQGAGGVLSRGDGGDAGGAVTVAPRGDAETRRHQSRQGVLARRRLQQERPHRLLRGRRAVFAALSPEPPAGADPFPRRHPRQGFLSEGRAGLRSRLGGHPADLLQGRRPRHRLFRRQRRRKPALRGKTWARFRCTSGPAG